MSVGLRPMMLLRTMQNSAFTQHLNSNMEKYKCQGDIILPKKIFNLSDWFIQNILLMEKDLESKYRFEAKA